MDPQASMSVQVEKDVVPHINQYNCKTKVFNSLEALM